MPKIAQRDDLPRLKRRIAVSSKRQITIPIEFYNVLKIENEVECSLQNNALVIRPLRDSSGEFDEQILADLIKQGLTGDALLQQFKETRRKVRPAVEKMLAEAKSAAAGIAESSSYEDVFGSGDSK